MNKTKAAFTILAILATLVALLAPAVMTDTA